VPLPIRTDWLVTTSSLNSSVVRFANPAVKDLAFLLISLDRPSRTDHFRPGVVQTARAGGFIEEIRPYIYKLTESGERMAGVLKWVMR
jgi:hypothetical protein